MLMKVSFPGAMAVEASVGSFTVRTDQPVSSGGDNTAPSPYLLFLSSIATCAGFFALRFCQQREITTQGMELIAAFETNQESHKLEKVRLELKLPDGFPEKYEQAIVRAMDQCTVKRAINDPPEFEITTVIL
jgi:ribosomal protein S12 methylthiotransferase accessory factor